MPRIMPVRQIGLQIDAGGSFALGPLAWIWSNGGVDLRTTTASAHFRQLYSDEPLLMLSNTTSASGQIDYLEPVPDFPYLPPQVGQEEGAQPVAITLYPFSVTLTDVGVSSLVVVPYCRWSLSFAWPGGPTVVFCVGNVEMARV